MEKIVKNNKDGNVIDNIFPNAEEAIENAREKGSEYLKLGKKGWGQTKGFIQKHPGQTVVYAFLLAVVVGVLFSSKGKK